MKKDEIIGIAAILFFLVGLVYFVIYQRGKYDFLIQKGVKTEAVGVRCPGGVLWSYYAGNIKVSQQKRRISKDFQNREKFYVYYDENDIEEFAVSYEEFVLDGDYLKTSSLSISENRFSNKNIVFTYRVNGVDYKRFQKIDINKINFTKDYVVKYNSANPYMAYVIVDD